MTISNRDTKILWTKAVGRCSMPSCRKKLIDDASPGATSQSTIIGENCHIVAEKKDGPRGISTLTKNERNSYPNLILFCRNHHAEIDQDVKKWTIEKLHQIKSDHVIWAETLLTEAENSPAEKLYSKLINLATEKLLLEHWAWLTDHAIRDLLPLDFVEGVSDFGSVIFKTIWPKEIPDFEEKIMNLNEKLGQYVNYYTKFAILNNNEFYVKDYSWKKEKLDQAEYERRLEAIKKWQKKSGILLGNLVLALNEFAESVRKYLNPEYFLLQGKFTIVDSLGVTNNMVGREYIPEKYKEMDI